MAGADAAGGSGLDTVQYRLDGGAWTTYAGVVTVSGAGSHTLEHRSTDKAGNTSDTGTVTFTIAGGAGAPVVRGFVDPASGPAPLTVRFSATGVDPDGGTLSYEWSIGNGVVLDADAQFTFTEPGVHTATVKVTDDEGMTATDSGADHGHRARQRATGPRWSRRPWTGPPASPRTPSSSAPSAPTPTGRAASSSTRGTSVTATAAR
jgi:PKD repeat protein